MSSLTWLMVMQWQRSCKFQSTSLSPCPGRQLGHSHTPWYVFLVFVFASWQLFKACIALIQRTQANAAAMLQARMLYTYKLPNGVLRLSDKAEYYADASDAYRKLAKVYQ